MISEKNSTSKKKREVLMCLTKSGRAFLKHLLSKQTTFDRLKFITKKLLKTLKCNIKQIT